MNPKAAVLVLLFSSAAWAAPVPFEAATPKLRAAFLSHQQGQPTLDQAVQVAPPADKSKAAAYQTMQNAIEAAKDVELGCQAPCADLASLQVYSGKVELTARRLGLPENEVQQALNHYIPNHKPRLRGAASTLTPAGQAMEAEVVARMLAEGRLSPKLRGALQQKALAMAAALGRTQVLKADADGVVTMPDGQRARMTAAQLAKLNAIPQTQARILRELATKAPPPPPTKQQLQDEALAEAEREIQAHPGTVGDAYNYWKREAADPNSGWAWRAYAKTNMGLLTFSGLKSVEESAGRLGYVWDNPNVSKGEKFWLGTKLAGNAALSAVSFLPAASFAKSLQAGEGFYWIGKAGAAVPGAVRVAAPEAAEASRGLTTVIAETLPKGVKAGKDELRTMLTALDEKAAKYGVRVIEGGTAGESTAVGGDVFVSLKAGAQHESVHAVQQVYSRVIALEQMAARSGTSVEALTAAQRAEAFANAARWETASYAQLESQAYRATGFMGSSGGANYTEQLLLTGREVTQGMTNGTVLKGEFGLGARFYGRLTQVLGHSQAQIATGMGSITSGVIQTDLLDPARGMIEGEVRPYTDPVYGTTRLINTGTKTASLMLPGGALLQPVVNRYLIRPVPIR